MLKDPGLACFSADCYQCLSSIATSVRSVGRVAKKVGLTLESIGPQASVGDLVEINCHARNEQVLAEVVGFRDERVLLLPFEHADGVRCGDTATVCNAGFRISVGDALLGRVIDSLGRPIDDKGPIKGAQPWSVNRLAPNSMRRRRVTEKLGCGVRAIDSMLTCGRGQRLGIFAGSGVGKSTLMGMLCRNGESDINVIALVGERGKEVLDFIHESLGEEGMKRTVLVTVTSDKSPLQRVKAGETAMAIAEYFRDQQKNVMFIMDSATRLAMAQREVGLAAGEPPATKGYPPSVFALLPRLLERAGTNEYGTITAFITVLVEGDDMNDPIADTVRGILDGHIVLSRSLAERGHYPAIDVLQSVSRAMKDVVTEEHLKLARKTRELLATYYDAEDMINIGAYSKGSNPKIDRAVDKHDALTSFLQQSVYEDLDFEQEIQQLKGIVQQ